MKFNKIFSMVAMGAIVLTGCMKVKNEVITSTYDSSKTPVTSIEYVEGESSATTMTFNVYGAAAKAAGSTTFTVFLATDVESDVLGNGATFKIVDAADTVQVKFTKLKEGDVYRPRVRANYDPFIYSSWTDIPGKAALVGTGLVDLAFGAPLNVTTTPTDETLAVKWSQVPYATSYIVESKAASASEWEVSQPQTTNSYTIVGLTEFTDYDVRVKAVNKDAQESDYKAVIAKTQKAFSFKKKEQVIEFFTSRAAAAAATDKFSLAADIDMGGATLPAVATFVASFDGQGHALKNFKASAPLFSELSGKVSNLTIEGEYAIDAANVADFGSVAAVCKEKGSIENVVNNSDIVVSGSEFTAALRIGGIVGAAEGKISGCENKGKVSIVSESNVVGLGLGGIAGYLANEMKGCVNKGDITLQGKSVKAKATVGDISSVLPTIGGCVGLGAGVGKFSMSKCSNSGKVTYCFDEVVLTANLNRDQEGGIVGSPCGPVTDCINTGDIYVTLLISSGNYEYNLCIGGIGGGDYYLTSDSKEPYCNTAYTGCENKGNIVVETNSAKANSTLGGIVGWPGQEKGHKVFTTNCKNTGNLTVKGAAKIRVGGIQGGSGNMEKCTNEGAIVIEGAASSSVAGALCGFHSQGHAITNCVVKGSVESKVKLTGIGGLVGNIGNAKHTTGEGCSVDCSLKGTDDTSEIGLIVGYFNGSSSAITLGTEASKIKVAGSVNGTTITAGNYSEYLHGPKNYSTTNHILNAEYGK